MRTTVTLDDDLAIRLERLSQEQGRSFKSLINEALRAGLEVLQRVPERRASDDAADYTLPFDLGQTLFGDMLPSRALSQLEKDEDVVRFGRLDVPG